MMAVIGLGVEEIAVDDARRVNASRATKATEAAHPSRDGAPPAGGIALARAAIFENVDLLARDSAEIAAGRGGSAPWPDPRAADPGDEPAASGTGHSGESSGNDG
jgi:hypothetical protein